MEAVCPPMLAPFVWDYRWTLDLDAMQSAAQAVLGEHDFTSFAASDPDRAARESLAQGDEVELPRGNIRTLYHSEWFRRDFLLYYRVTGSGFLHHMVRNLVGTFVDVGSLRLDAAAVSGILAARRRGAAGATAPARGLFLVSVEYPLKEGE